MDLIKFAEDHPILTLGVLQASRAIGSLFGKEVSSDEDSAESRSVDSAAQPVLSTTDAPGAPPSTPLTTRTVRVDTTSASHSHRLRPAAAFIDAPIPANMKHNPTNVFEAFAVEMGIQDPKEVRAAALKTQVGLLERIDTRLNRASAWQRIKELRSFDEVIAANAGDNQSAVAKAKELRKPYALWQAMENAYQIEKRGKLENLHAELDAIPESQRSTSPKALYLQQQIQAVLRTHFDPNQYLNETSIGAYKERSGDLTALSMAYDATINVYEMGEDGPFIARVYGDGKKQINLLKDNERYLPATPKNQSWMAYAEKHPLLTAGSMGLAPLISKVFSWVKGLFYSDTKKINEIASTVLSNLKATSAAASLKERTIVQRGEAVEGPRVLKIPQNENSLFHAVAIQLHSNNNHAKVRARVVATQKKLLEGINTEVNPDAELDRKSLRKHVNDVLKNPKNHDLETVAGCVKFKQALDLWDAMEKSFEDQAGVRAAKIAELKESQLKIEQGMIDGLITHATGIPTVAAIKAEIKSIAEEEFNPNAYLADMAKNATGTYAEVLTLASALEARINVYTLGPKGPILSPSNVIGTGTQELNIMIDEDGFFQPIYPARAQTQSTTQTSERVPHADVAGDRSNLYHAFAEIMGANDFNAVRSEVLDKQRTMFANMNIGLDAESEAERNTFIEGYNLVLKDDDNPENRLAAKKSLQPYQLFNAMRNIFEVEKKEQIAVLTAQEEGIFASIRSGRANPSAIASIQALREKKAQLSAEQFNPATYTERVGQDKMRRKLPEIMTLSSAYNVTFNIYEMGAEGPKLSAGNVIGQGNKSINVLYYDGQFLPYVPGQEVSPPPVSVTKGTLTNVPGDGNCLFHSVAIQFGNDDHQTIRAVVAKQQNDIMENLESDNALAKEKASTMLVAMQASFESEKESTLIRLRSSARSLENAVNSGELQEEEVSGEHQALMREIAQVQNSTFNHEIYMEKTAQDRTYAKAAEILALVDVYDITINVYRMGPNGPALNQNDVYGDGAKQINLFLHGDHYQPYLPEDSDIKLANDRIITNTIQQIEVALGSPESLTPAQKNRLRAFLQQHPEVASNFTRFAKAVASIRQLLVQKNDPETFFALHLKEECNLVLKPLLALQDELLKIETMNDEDRRLLGNIRKLMQYRVLNINHQIASDGFRLGLLDQGLDQPGMPPLEADNFVEKFNEVIAQGEKYNDLTLLRALKINYIDPAKAWTEGQARITDPAGMARLELERGYVARDGSAVKQKVRWENAVYNPLGGLVSATREIQFLNPEHETATASATIDLSRLGRDLTPRESIDFMFYVQLLHVNLDAEFATKWLIECHRNQGQDPLSILRGLPAEGRSIGVRDRLLAEYEKYINALPLTDKQKSDLVRIGVDFTFNILSQFTKALLTV